MNLRDFQYPLLMTNTCTNVLNFLHNYKAFEQLFGDMNFGNSMCRCVIDAGHLLHQPFFITVSRLYSFAMSRFHTVRSIELYMECHFRI